MVASSSSSPWRRSRWALALFWALTLIVGWLVLRLVLFFQFHVEASAGQFLFAFLDGAYRDVFAAAWLTLPLVFCLLVLPDRFFRAAWRRAIFWAVCFVFWAGEIFLLFVEYYFFEEFRSRFNTVAVDYLQYPKEVSGNIWDSYPVVVVLLVCFGLAVAWVL